MDLNTEEFVEQLLTKEALEKPSDSCKPDNLVMELPEWFDEKKFNKARRFFWEHSFSFSTSMFMGLVVVLAVPSILKVLIGSKKSSSANTAYKRYVSSLLHVFTWFEHELKPNTVSWKSLFVVRSRHLRAGLASKLKGGDVVSQRDLALTQFSFIGLSLLRPDKFGIRQIEEGDWEAYNHFWRVIGYMIGMDDRYNVCETVEKTRQVYELLLERVYTPCLENVPEYFEHMARVMLDGMRTVNSTLDPGYFLYATRNMFNVPGYIYTEGDRIEFQKKLIKQLKLEGKTFDAAVESTSLISKAHVDGLPDRPPRKLYVRDYDCIENVPEYKRLSFSARYKLAFNHVSMAWYTTYLGRMLLNFYFRWNVILMKYFPYVAFFRFGIKQSLVNMFSEYPMDDTKPKTNDEYYAQDIKTLTEPLYVSLLSVFR